MPIFEILNQIMLMAKLKFWRPLIKNKIEISPGKNETSTFQNRKVTIADLLALHSDTELGSLRCQTINKNYQFQTETKRIKSQQAKQEYGLSSLCLPMKEEIFSVSDVGRNFFATLLVLQTKGRNRLQLFKRNNSSIARENGLFDDLL